MIKTFVGPTSRCLNPLPEDFEITFEGAVLATYERNMSDDSDFYAIVWDAEKQALQDVMYATTRGWTYNNSATIDAPPELTELAKPGLVEKLIERMVSDFAKPKEGSQVRSLTTRGKAKGLAGTISRIITSKYDPRGRDKVALVEGEIDGQLAEAWVDLYRLEVIGVPDLDAFRQAAESRVERQGVISVHRFLGWC